MKYAKIENDTINVYPQLPRVYQGIINFQNASQEALEENGFYPLVEPEFDVNTQKLDNLHFDEENKVFTYNIVDLTEEEIENLQEQKALEEVEAFNNKKKQDGQEYVKNLDNTVTAMLYGQPTDFVDPIVEDIEKYLRPLLDLIEKGQWYSAAKLVVGTPSNQDVIELKDMLIQDIVDYIRENYNHEVVIKDTTSIWDKIKNIFTN